MCGKSEGTLGGPVYLDPKDMCVSRVFPEHQRILLPFFLLS